MKATGRGCKLMRAVSGALLELTELLRPIAPAPVAATRRIEEDRHSAVFASQEQRERRAPESGAQQSCCIGTGPGGAVPESNASAGRRSLGCSSAVAAAQAQGMRSPPCGRWPGCSRCRPGWGPGAGPSCSSLCRPADAPGWCSTAPACSPPPRCAGPAATPPARHVGLPPLDPPLEQQPLPPTLAGHPRRPFRAAKLPASLPCRRLGIGGRRELRLQLEAGSGSRHSGECWR